MSNRNSSRIECNVRKDGAAILHMQLPIRVHAFSLLLSLTMIAFPFPVTHAALTTSAAELAAANSVRTVPTLPYSYQLGTKERETMPKWRLGRVYYASNSAPMARALGTHAEGVRGVDDLLRFFKSIEKRMELRMRRYSPSKGKSEREVCRVPSRFANYGAARFSIGVQGWGRLPMPPCVTEFENDGTDKHLKDIETFDRALNDVAMNVSNAVHGNWSFATGNQQFWFNTSVQSCKMVHIVGYRIDGFWALSAITTNHPVHAIMPDWKRHYYAEAVVKRPDGKLDAFPSVVRKRNENNTTQQFVNATTVYSVWGQRPSPSLFGNAPLEKNSAIHAALSVSQRLKEQAEDSTTPSNSLILMFPLLMALVPIALFADVSKIVALAYAIATDFVSVMPLFIKGIELLTFSFGRHFSTRTFAFGMKDRTSLAIAETWAAECFTDGVMGHRGAVFVAIALSAMIVGLVLEIVAWNKVQSNKRKQMLLRTHAAQRDILHGNRQPAVVEHVWTRAFVNQCQNCQCAYVHANDDAIAPLSQPHINAATTEQRAVQHTYLHAFAGGILSDVLRRRRAQ